MGAADSVSVPMPGEGFQVESYHLSIRPDMATGTVSGTETMTLRSTSADFVRAVFTPNALRIRNATADGISIAVSTDGNGIVFTLPRPVARGATVTLKFRFEGRPARGMTRTPTGIYTSYFACDWMVCLQDAPGDKAGFALDLYLPSGIDSVAVGTRAPLTADGLIAHRWRSTRPYPPYVFGFAAGRFPHVSTKSSAGALIYVNAAGGDEDLEDYFRQTPAIAEFLSGKAGLPLADRRYVQILVPGDEAQEAAGFSLIGAATLDEERTDPTSGWIVAHEMAHQWWGNLVTCATWRDFWLNEGMATFMVAAWKERSQGSAAYERELDIARRRVAKVRELGFDKPLAWPGRYPSLAARRAVQYSKGALFLAELRKTLGEVAFWRGIRSYTRGHAGQTVTSRDFQVAMERASGRGLGPLFNEWVFGGGPPGAASDR